MSKRKYRISSRVRHEAIRDAQRRENEALAGELMRQLSDTKIGEHRVFEIVGEDASGAPIYQMPSRERLDFLLSQAQTQGEREKVMIAIEELYG